MPSKLRKAIGAVKDQTSISFAKVANNNSSSIEVIILKATRHDDTPVDERYVNEILSLISSNKVYAAACARAISKRIGKTRNWIVALKSLMLVLRIFQDGDPYFPREVLHAMKRGAKILNLSNFRDDSNSSPWDYTSFVRTFALYLDERLDCFLTGKLQRRFTKKDKESRWSRGRNGSDLINDMKPAMLLNKISYWQKMLDRAIATKPTGAAKTNKLVQVSFYAIVQETFDLYRDISDGLALLLDSFFHLQYDSCVSAFQTCIKASKLFEELCSFYDLCKSIGVGRISEYPSVQKISEELIETLQEFLKDQSSFSNVSRTPTPLLLTASSPKNLSSSSEAFDQFSAERFSESQSEIGSQCTSLEDLMCGTDTPASPSMDHFFAQCEKQSQNEDVSGTDSGSVHSTPDQGTISRCNSGLDIVSLAGWPEDQNIEQEGQVQNSELDSNTAEANGWEIVLAETARQQPVQTLSNVANGSDSTAVAIFFNPDLGTSSNGIQSSDTHFVDQSSFPEHHYNPFLKDITEIPELAAIPTSDQASFPTSNVFSMQPKFTTAPWNNNENLFSQPATTTSSREFSDSLFPKQSNPTPEIVTNGNSRAAISSANDMFSVAPTFQATPPTFDARRFGNPQPEFAATPTFSFNNPGEISPWNNKENLFSQPAKTSSHEFNESLFLEQSNSTPEVVTNGGSQVAVSPANDMFSVSPTFQAAPLTFSAQNPGNARSEFIAQPTFSIKSPGKISPWNNKENLFSQPATTEREFNNSLFLEQSNATPEVVRNGNSQAAVFPANDMFSVAPTFQATPPTFSAQNSGNVVGSEIQDDLFAPFPTAKHESTVSMDQNNLLLQQQLWIQQQDKIIAKNMF